MLYESEVPQDALIAMWESGLLPKMVVNLQKEQ